MYNQPSLLTSAANTPVPLNTQQESRLPPGHRFPLEYRPFPLVHEVLLHVVHHIAHGGRQNRRDHPAGSDGFERTAGLNATRKSETESPSPALVSTSY